jgi:pimeloyl-ACP methyl ester carboxylesterase
MLSITQRLERFTMYMLAAAAVVAGVPLAIATAQASQQAPCTRAITACERWITVAGASVRSKVYATYPLDSLNAAVTRALVIVHGGERNADQYFETATAAGFLARALDNTVIVAPRYPADGDVRAANEAQWSAGGANTWRAGGSCTANPSMTSFDVMDEIVRKLADKKMFPNLTRIVVAGHSAGGQFVTRYAMANRVHDTRGVSLSYVTANPSSYAWPVAVRPYPTGDADPLAAANAALGPDGDKVRTNYSFGPFDASKAPDFNRWPAGFQDRVGYSARMDEEVLKRQLVDRPTTYVLGQLDVRFSNTSPK